MVTDGSYLILLTVASITLLLLLIIWLKLHAFLSLLISSMALGLAAGMPPEKVLKSIQNGFGEALGFIAVVVGLGTMIGRFLEYSGSGRALAEWMLEKAGRDRAAWALLFSAFLVGLPIFFEVGFIILVPVVWSLARESKRSLLYYGLPMAMALTMTHSLVPPHPAPAAASAVFGADLGRTILFGILVSLPMAIAGGIFYGKWISKRIVLPVPAIAATAKTAEDNGVKPPPIPMIILLLLLPVLLIFGATIANMAKLPGKEALGFLGHPFTALAVSALVALYFFGLRRGLTRDRVLKMAGESLAPMGALLCIMGGGGAFKQVIVDSGVGPYAGKLLATTAISPLLVAFVIAACLRFAQGSATVAIITAAGIVAPIVRGMPGYDADLTVLALCCGGSGLSNVNDAGFWIVNEYFGMSVPQTFKAWTGGKVLASFLGLLLVMVAHAIFK
jgi:gluconate transporter